MIPKRRGDLGQVTLLLTGLSIIMGSIYGFNVPRFGDPIWATVPWGISLVCVGAVVLSLRMTSRSTLSLGFQYVSLGLIAVMQIPPIVLWLVFDGQGVGEHGATPVGHWAWAIPHLILALLALYSGYLVRPKPNDIPRI